MKVLTFSIDFKKLRIELQILSYSEETKINTDSLYQMSLILKRLDLECSFQSKSVFKRICQVLYIHVNSVYSFNMFKEKKDILYQLFSQPGIPVCH